MTDCTQAGPFGVGPLVCTRGDHHDDPKTHVYMSAPADEHQDGGGDDE